jgi:exodeoxyribonuclease VII small subunit
MPVAFVAFQRAYTESGDETGIWNVATGDRFLQLRSHPQLAFVSMATTSDAPASFEAALAELEEIVATMEGGQLPLKESLAAYKRGAALLHYCQAALTDAQQQVEILEKGVLMAFAPAVTESAADDDGP